MMKSNIPALPTFSFDVNNATINVFTGINAGDGHPKHEHDYDHVTTVTSGRLKVTTPNVSFEMDKNTKPILFPANEWHELEALEDNTSFINVFGLNQQGQRSVSDM